MKRRKIWLVRKIWLIRGDPKDDRYFHPKDDPTRKTISNQKYPKDGWYSRERCPENDLCPWRKFIATQKRCDDQKCVGSHQVGNQKYGEREVTPKDGHQNYRPVESKVDRRRNQIVGVLDPVGCGGVASCGQHWWNFLEMTGVILMQEKHFYITR